jgi:hypothetical protein
VDSVGGITKAHSQSLGGAQLPRGCHPGFIQSSKEHIFNLTVIRRNLEARALSLGQFLRDSVEYSHQGEFIQHLQQLLLVSGTAYCRSICACADLSTSSVHGYFVLVALYSSDDP